jgi:hypothetical protein
MAPWIVPIDVHVKEYTGELVAKLRRPAAVDELCAFAADDPARYPLLSGIDEYDDTYFNRRQASRLIVELKNVAGTANEPALLNAATEIMALADLLKPAPGRPAHRQLIFIGD